MSRVALFLLAMLHTAATAQTRVLEMLVYPNAGVFEAAPGKGPGGPGGAMLERLRALSGVTLNQQFMPVPRAMLTVRQHPGHCMVAVTRTPEREALFMWAGPWARGATAVFARADDTRSIQHPQELRGSSIVVLRESAPADWLANDLAAQFVVRAEGGPVPKQLYNFGRIDLYMGCHPASDPAAVAALDLAIAQMRRSGELAEFGLR